VAAPLKVHDGCDQLELRYKSSPQEIQYKYSRAPISMGKVFQDLPQLSETADNTKCNI
jgi:hypothetical protein